MLIPVLQEIYHFCLFFIINTCILSGDELYFESNLFIAVATQKWDGLYFLGIACQALPNTIILQLRFD